MGWKLKLGNVGADIRPYYLRSGGNALEAVEACRDWAASEGPFEEVYCVCDVDDTSPQDLSDAVGICEKAQITLCVSTRSFEVWLALHWEKISLSPLVNEKDAINLVSKHHNKYCKKEKEVDFAVLFPMTEQACRNADWLSRQGISNPGTNVHVLVSRLMKLYKKRSVLKG
ncbi:hypothetical protein Y590_15808 [Methylobacterium sp. AMS5]|nr:hypothetical protein Y590_15808 [Methylobacterium sp. AMS5]